MQVLICLFLTDWCKQESLLDSCKFHKELNQKHNLKVTEDRSMVY